MKDNETIVEPVFNNPQGIDKDYLVDPDYAESRGWGVYYLEDRMLFDDLRELVPDSSLSSGVYIKMTSLDKHETTKFVGSFQDFWDIIIGINSDRCCVFDDPNTFLLSVIDADGSIIATDRRLMQKLFGVPEMSRAEWIEEAARFRPDLRDEVLAKYVRAA